MISRIGSTVSGWWRSMRGNRRSSASSAFVAASAVGLVVAMFLADEFRATSYDLQDSAVWVSKGGSEGAIGRINTQIGKQDATLSAGGETVDVAQDGRNVFLVEGDTLTRIDPATVSGESSSGVELPESAEVRMGAETLAVVADGKVWVTDVESVGSLGSDEDPDLELGPSGAVEVGREGDVVAWSSESGRLTLGLGTGSPREVAVLELGADRSPGEVQVTLAGDQPVLLDQAEASLHLPGGTIVDLGELGAEPQLQLPGDDDAQVVVATADGLWSVPIEGGEPARILGGDGGAAPIRPVRLAGCTYGAWQGPEPLSAAGWACDGVEPQGPVPLEVNTDQLRFRMNRKKAVLNELTSGVVWMVEGDQLKQVDDWETDDPTKEIDEDEEEDGTSDQPLQSEENRPPEAADDETGARPGRATVIPVLDNDVDPDGDLLNVVEVTGAPSGIDAAVVLNGQAVQVTLPDAHEGDFSLSYRISDGRSSEAECADTCTASVSVAIRQPSENAPPVRKSEVFEPFRDPPFEVEAGKSATYDELQTWWDPDGDPLTLVTATIGNPDDRVVPQASGVISYIDAATSVGRKEIEVTVADLPPPEAGPLTVDAVRSVDVTAAGTPIKPRLVPDYLTALVDTDVVIRPLANDVDGNGDTLRLTGLYLDTLPGGAAADLIGDTEIRFRAATAGSYVFGYLVGGAEDSRGLIRVDVLPPPTENRPPVAGRDVVVVPAGAMRTVDLISNDRDPDGDVLVVTDARLRGDPGRGELRLQPLEHSRLRVAVDPLTPTGVYDAEYGLSDGNLSTTGSVVIQVVEAALATSDPLPRPDRATVRVSDVVSIPVLLNDVDPDGDQLHLCAASLSDVGEQRGRAFVAGSAVRYLAAAQPGSVQIRYEVDDDVGCSQPQVGDIDVTVIARGANQAPTARSLEARAVAGGEVRITVPLSGSDPDGDSVVLVGLGRAKSPTKGIVVTPVARDRLVYRAGTGPADIGTDEFTYLIQDSQGATAEGTVRVGIAPRSAENQPPVALDDRATIRPGVPTPIPVLANDYDPDDDLISIATDRLAFDDGRMSAEVVSDKVVVEADQDSAASYTITDCRGEGACGGLSSTAKILVSVDPEAPGRAPVAVDDVVLSAPAGETSVSVEVLENDDDPDGTREELELSGDGLPAWAVVGSDGRSIDVELSGAPRLFAYTVTDPDGLSASAVVRVPATGTDLPPRQLDGDELSVRVGADPLQILLADVVEDPEGERVLLRPLAGDATVRATHGTARALEGGEGLQFTPEARFSGRASVTFAVTDGGRTDSTKNVVVISLPITVIPAEGDNQPPVWEQVPVLEVARGETSSPLDLAGYARDPEGDDLTFEVSREQVLGGTVETAASGSTVEATATDQATIGQSAEVQGTVTDGNSDPVPIRVKVEVIDTTVPLPVCSPPEAVDADAGAEVSANVLERCQDFGDGELTLASTVSARGGTGAAGGSTVRFTPDRDFLGVAQVSYEVIDRFGRTVSATWEVRVRDVPDAPGAPRVVAVASRTVELEWTVPRPNGADIDEYEVRWAGGSRSCERVNRCVIDGLTNGETYRFTVRAHNEVGWSDESSPSGEAMPDQVPGIPENVQLIFRQDGNPAEGRRLYAEWDPPVDEGSAVQSYDVYFDSGVLYREGVEGTSVVVDTPTNGDSYRVHVYARNLSHLGDEPGISNAATPGRVPDQPDAPVAERVPSDLGRQINVTWTRLTTERTGGLPILSYTLQILENGTPVASPAPFGADVTEANVTVDTFDSDYTFTVVAENLAGSSPRSNPTARSVRPYAPPEGLVAPVAAQPFDGRVELDFEAPDARGGTITRYQVIINGGAPEPVVDTSIPLSISGLTNGEYYTFSVRACNGVECAPSWSVPSDEVQPYGPPNVPEDLSASASGRTITWTWNEPPRLNGRRISGYDILLDGQLIATDRPGTSYSNGSFGYSETHRLVVVAVDTQNQRSAASPQIPGTTGGPPIAGQVTVADSFCGGTWQRNATHGGAWGCRAAPTTGGVAWSGNGAVLNFVCSMQGGAYTVSFVGGGSQTWNWWLRLDNGNYVRTAAMQQINNNGAYGPQC